MTSGDWTITPVVRSLVVRWTGGGLVRSRPAAVRVEREGTTRRIPVRDLNARIIWAIRVGAAGLVAAAIARDRKRRKSDD